MSHDFPPTGKGPGVRTGGDTPTRFRPLPLRLVVAGRFGLPSGRLHRLDADGAGGLLGRSGPGLALRVPDRLRADGTDLTVELRFQDRRDFAPGAIARAVPELARLASAHTAIRGGKSLSAVQADLAEFGALRTALDDSGVDAGSPAQPVGPRPAARPTETSGDDSLDRLLDMVDTPDQTAPDQAAPARSAVSGFIAEVVRSTNRRRTAGTPPEIVENLLAEQIEAIMSHPDFAALERAWSALRFLARRADLRAGIAVDVLEADADGLADALEATVPEDDLDGAGPVRLVVDLNDYDSTDRDVARLRRLATFGASRRAVVLSNADPAFSGAAGVDGLAGMHDPETHFETAEYAGWHTLRDAPEAAWLGLCLSRIALRDAIDGRDDKVLRFAHGRRIGHPLDVGTAPAVAALLAEASAATDWACAAGTGTDPIVDNLVLPHDAAGGFAGPVRPAITLSAAKSLGSAGLITLVPERGRDTARLILFPSVRRGGGADGSLTERLFQAQVVHGLQWNADRIFTSSSAVELRDRVERCLTALLGGTGPGAAAEVRVVREDDETVLAVHARSGSRAAPGASIAFDIPLGPASAT